MLGTRRLTPDGQQGTAFRIQRCCLLPVACCLLSSSMAAESFYAAGDRLLLRWFDEERLGFAFGCVFATGEFGGALAFYLGALLAHYQDDAYMTVYLVGEW